jgi:hypothetical protein
MAKFRQVSREPLWLMSVGQGAIVRAEIKRWQLLMISCAGRGELLHHSPQPPPARAVRLLSTTIPANPATSLGRRQFKFDVYLWKW